MKTPLLNVIEGGDPSRRQAAAWFARMHADDVAERDRQGWQQWMAADPRHRAAYERIERLWSAAGEHAQHPQIAQRLREAVAPPAAAPKRRSRAGYAWGAAAAAAALALALFVPGLLRRPAPEQSYLTQVGESRTIALDDGSRISMDTDSRLVVAYSDAERRITLLRGRAYFRVAKQARPFLVRSEEGSVRAVGTEFEVYRYGDALEVALVEGRVALLAAPASADAEPTLLAMLDPGQKARFGKRRPLQRLAPAAPGTRPGWLSGKLVFDDRNLAEAVAEFNRYSRRRLVVDGDEAAQLRVSGVFRSDDPHAFAEALQELYPVAVDESAERIRISSRR
ncbi:FecR domain-containing protein [Lysobacter sp. BMK333-48F3]|uniref:FecR family protein n=1 Tax=Lysobacter sp. BMK333-48F3 TaxID=2867962 RepID=UPI001C8CA8C6|nr:FecR domain-containing protein [Lysobacter sp. BMK333-48F3]